MRILTTSLLVATLALTACNSRVNPANWGRGNQAVVPASAEPEEVNPLIPENVRGNIFQSLTQPNEEYFGIPIDEIRSVVVESVPGGAIVRATGVADYQDVFDVRLIPENIDEEPIDGVLTYTLAGVYLEEAARGGPEAVRTVIAGVTLTDNQLAETRTIRIVGGRNAQTTQRR